MKRFPIYATMAAAMLTGVTACSDSNDVTGTSTSGDGTVSYVSVNIVNPQSPTAGAGAKASGLTRADGDYVNGNNDEGKISNVRFYFFNSDGSPYLLANSNPANVNWLNYNITSQTPRTNDPNTIESVTNAMLVIQGATGTTPTYMIAVANPGGIQKAQTTSTQPDNLLGDGTMNRDALTATTMQTRSFNGGDGFIMTNTVYGEGGTYRCATPTEGHVRNSEQGAMENPVQIYVERLAAKVSVSHSTDSRWSVQNVNGKNCTTFNLGNYTYRNVNGRTATPVNVYAVVTGVGLADEQRFGDLFKNIDGFVTNNNTSNELGIDPWNSADYHRCFWEVTPEFNAINTDNPIDYSFNQYTSGFYAGRDSAGGVFYTMPNTPRAVQTPEDANRSNTQTYRTKVLLAAQLMTRDANGVWTPAEVCSYRGQNYLGENDVKQVIANELRGRMCKFENNTYRSLRASDIEFRVPTQAETNYKSYEVIPQLADRNGQFALVSADSATRAAAAGNAPQTYSPSANNGNTPELDAVFYAYADKAQIRKGGDTYYYTSIRHLSNDQTKLGYFGVVRNHWYQVNINSLAGFGTPVYDPDQPIIPITPSDETSYMAAQINVLQWRIVANDYDIDGTTKHQ